MSAPSTDALSASPREPPRIGLLESLSRVRRFRRDALSVVQAIYERHGPVVAEGGVPMRAVHLFGPDASRLVLQDRDDVFSARYAWTLIMGRIFPNGLLLRDGEDHLHHRRTMQG
ncbi:MAG: hypothetical protein ACHQ53_19445, partial [Polyangiales bacterium]